MKSIVSNKDKILKKIRKFLYNYALDLSFSHGFDHAERVCKMALFISEREGGDSSVLEIAALLHDIGIVPLAALKRELTSGDKGEEHIQFMSYLIKKTGHGEISSIIARNLLKETNLPNDKLEQICKIIEDHDTGTSQIAKKSLETKILNDADALDRSGATWIARAFQRTNAFDKKLRIETTINKYLKTSNYKPRHTKTAQGMLDKRVTFQNKFLRQLENELQLKS